MFMFISEKNCPSCGTCGKSWEKHKDIFVCPSCNSLFNEFGVIRESQVDDEVSF